MNMATKTIPKASVPPTFLSSYFVPATLSLLPQYLMLLFMIYSMPLLKCGGRGLKPKTEI